MREREIDRGLADMQGKLFELSGEAGYDSEAFIRVFMNSKIAAGLDSRLDFMQWAGKEYILERMQEEYPEGCVKDGKIYDCETLYWIGYVYRYWHYYTGKDSKNIYKMAGAKVMNSMYPGYHTLDVEMAIDRLTGARA